MAGESLMTIITPDIYDASKHSFWFPSVLKSPLVLLVKELRPEVIYDSDSQPERSALATIRNAAKSLPGRPYAVMADGRIGPKGGFRSRKGILPLQSPLRQLDHFDLEAPIGSGGSRLGVLFTLGYSVPAEDSGSLLNFVNGVLVFSSLPREDICAVAKDWLGGNETRSFGLNFDAIAVSLVNHSETIVLRHFPADNGRNEELVMVGNGISMKVAEKVLDNQFSEYANNRLTESDIQQDKSSSSNEGVVGDQGPQFKSGKAGEKLRRRDDCQ
jgi:hypothetical protein